MGRSGFGTAQGAVMSPRRRKELNPRSKDFSVRFAIGLRELLEKRELTTAEFWERVQAAGVDVSQETVKCWLNGTRLPLSQDLPGIGVALRMKDYRDLLPRP